MTGPARRRLSSGRPGRGHTSSDASVKTQVASSWLRGEIRRTVQAKTVLRDSCPGERLHKVGLPRLQIERQGERQQDHRDLCADDRQDRAAPYWNGALQVLPKA